MKAPRCAEINRKTKETDIIFKLNLDGGKVTIGSGIGFFDHMLNSLATYSGFGFELSCTGDLHVDHHHSVEDIGIVIGDAICTSLGDYSGHQRFSSSLIPMDDALAELALDAGRRPYLHFQVNWPQKKCGDFELCLVEEFWRALSQRAGFTLHIIGRHGANSHHLCEAVFKAAGLAMKEALAPRQGTVLSTKGVL